METVLNIIRNLTTDVVPSVLMVKNFYSFVAGVPVNGCTLTLTQGLYKQCAINQTLMIVDILLILYKIHNDKKMNNWWCAILIPAFIAIVLNMHIMSNLSAINDLDFATNADAIQKGIVENVLPLIMLVYGMTFVHFICKIIFTTRYTIGGLFGTHKNDEKGNAIVKKSKDDSKDGSSPFITDLFNKKPKKNGKHSKNSSSPKNSSSKNSSDSKNSDMNDTKDDM